MNTSCPKCGAPLTQRTWIRNSPPLFVEVYGCGAVHAFGLVTTDLPPLFGCEGRAASPPQEDSP